MQSRFTDFLTEHYFNLFEGCITVLSVFVTHHVFYQTGVPDDCRYPGHPAAPPEANCARPTRLQHRHFQPRVSQPHYPGPAGVGHPCRSEPGPGSTCTAGKPHPELPLLRHPSACARGGKTTLIRFSVEFKTCKDEI